MLRRWLTRVLLFLSLSVPFSAMAEQWYVVELLIFSRPAASEKQQHLLTEQSLPPLSGVRELGYGSSAGTFQLVDTPSMDLRAEAERLRGAGFKVIRHLAWRQPGLTPAQSKPVRITERGGDLLEGTVRVSLSRYMQLEADLAYFDPPRTSPSFEDNAGPAPKHFRLTESRWMKLGEVHYFDHPTFGVIATISRK